MCTRKASAPGSADADGGRIDGGDGAVTIDDHDAAVQRCHHRLIVLCGIERVGAVGADEDVPGVDRCDRDTHRHRPSCQRVSGEVAGTSLCGDGNHIEFDAERVADQLPEGVGD